MSNIDELREQLDFVYIAQPPPSPSKQMHVQIRVMLEIARQLERIADALEPRERALGDKVARFTDLITAGENEDVAAWLADIGEYPV